MTEGRAAASPPSPDIDPVGYVPEGSLTFVGGGPGDPELLTLAGANALREAALVVVDNDEQRLLVSALGLVDGPEVVVVDADEYAQLRRATAAGKDVVRLVPGDLFLDGDASVLARTLADGEGRVDVVPGLGIATSVLTYAGVPASEWSFVNATEAMPEQWPSSGALLAKANGDRLPAIADACDRPGTERVLVVESPGQTSQTSELTTWSQLGGARADGDVFLIAGAALDDQVDWFASKPLFDWRVLVPVAKDQGGAVSAGLAAHGALPHEVPTMMIEPPRSEQHMERAVRGIVDGRYKWVVFTSAHAVDGVRARFAEFGLDARAMSGTSVAAVGGGTARALADWGIAADLMPAGHQTTAMLAATFPAFDDFLDPINRVLVPRAEISTDALLAGLEGLGWEVEDVTAYRTVRASPPPAETREAIKTGLFDAVVFASGSTVRNLIGIAGKPHTNMVVVAIGAATAKTCEEHGLRVDAVSPEPTARALADTLAKFARERRHDQLAKGEQPTKPSQRRRRRRKRTIEVLDEADDDLLG